MNIRVFPHYYGDVVRILFLIAGLIMLASLPFYHDLTRVPLIISVLLILGIGILAGFTNPKVIYIIIFDFFISLGGFIISEYIVVDYFHDYLIYSLINQALAIVFFIALYYSTKTLRGFLIRKRII